MSKKSREKSPNKSAAAVTATTAGAKAGTASKKSAAAASKSAVKKAVKPPAKTPAKASKTKASKVSKPRSAPSATSSTNARPKAAAKSTSKASSLAQGAKALAFRLPRDGGASVALADYAGQKLVIFFYPRADTPGCTREAIDFTRLSGEFATAKTAVLGVSADPMKAQESFQKKHSLAMPLMSDETHTMLESYGAWGEKSMYGKTFEGVLRTTVLIDQTGRIARIWHGVKVEGHADEVLAAARGI